MDPPSLEELHVAVNAVKLPDYCNDGGCGNFLGLMAVAFQAHNNPTLSNLEKAAITAKCMMAMSGCSLEELYEDFKTGAISDKWMPKILEDIQREKDEHQNQIKNKIQEYEAMLDQHDLTEEDRFIYQQRLQIAKEIHGKK